MSHWLIVGISGITNGGKSTLTKKLAERLPSTTRVLNQDDYFYPEDSSHHIPCPGGLAHHNWDVISSVDMNRMLKDIREIIQSSPGEDLETLETTDHSSTASLTRSLCNSAIGATRPVLLLDGFILFGSSQLARICDLCYFLTLTREQCWERRKTRVYEPPDPPGYFELCVWPEYESHLQYIKKSVPNVVYLNGIDDHFATVYQEVVAASKLPPPACKPFVSM